MPARTRFPAIPRLFGPLRLNLLVLLAACGWLALHFPHDSLWYDETVNAYLATSDWATVWEWTTAIDNQPPLHFVALKLWGGGLGNNSPFALRAFSTLCGLLAVAGTVRLGQQTSGSPVAGRLAALFLPLSGGFLYAAGEVRTYGLALALLVWSLVFFWRWLARLGQESRPGADWAAYMLTTAALLLAHYTALAVLAGQGLLVAARLWQRRGRGWRLAALSGGLWLALLGLWWAVILQGRDINAGTAFAGTVTTETALRAYWFFLAFGQKVVTPAQDTWLWGLAGLVIVGGLVWGWRVRRGGLAGLGWLLALSLTLVPLLAMLAAVTLVEGKLAGRHAWPIWVGAALLAGAGTAHLAQGIRWRAGRLVLAGLVLSVPLAASRQAGQLPDEYRGDFEHAFAILRAEAQPTDLLVLRDGTLFTAAEYYGSPIPYMRLPEVAITDVTQPLHFFPAMDALNAALTEDTTAIWVLSWQGDTLDPTRLAYGVPEYLSGGGLEIWLAEGPPLAPSTVSLYRYPLPQPRPEPLYEHIVDYPGVLQVSADGPSLLGMETYPFASGGPVRACGVMAHTWWWRGTTDYPDTMLSLRVLAADDTRLGIQDQRLAPFGFGQARWTPFEPVLARLRVDVPCEAFEAGETYRARLVVYDATGQRDAQAVELLTFTAPPGP